MSFISQQELKEILIVPITIEVLLYGVFVVLFGFSLYVFRKKVMPGMLYVVATLIFFTLATISIPLDLAGRYSYFLVRGGNIESIAKENQQLVDMLKLLSVPYYIFAVAGILSDALMLTNATLECYIILTFILVDTSLLPSMELKKICHYLALSRIDRNLHCVLEVLALKDLPGIAVNDSIDKAFSETYNFTSQVYGCASLAENIILTGLMAGRVWWLEHRMKNILTEDKNNRKVSQSLLGTILQSGALNPTFLSIWVVSAYSSTLNTEGLQFLSPCALTQVFGISSTLIILSIGIGLDSESRSRMLDQENQSLLLSESVEESQDLHTEIREILNQLSNLATNSAHLDHPTVAQYGDVHPSSDTIQPFALKYDHDALAEQGQNIHK
ncbi:hypothetical protein BDP27DRAFT_1435301 [Rhodocollybia butyracea]|uniref:Uncharacterized protein n=1 Tax=Rhodocollybia butyracea TaxID=206335 RepID=A0A9P5P616_9AGAR|nr:hypothetical protein BDP27DRAFT_1435301 [Rhodocollybia butyracea]